MSYIPKEAKIGIACLVLGAQKISLAKTCLVLSLWNVWSSGGDRETNKPTHCLDKSCNEQKHRVLSMKRGVMSHLTASLGKIFKMAHSHGCSFPGWESIAQVGLLTRSPPYLHFMWLAFHTAW